MAEVDSSTGGFLAPAEALAPVEDDELQKIFQNTVVGITGIAGSLVRPRWQPGNPVHPEPLVNWCAIGVTVSEPDAGPVLEHLSEGEGSDRYVRHEDIQLATTFYGPAARAGATRLRDGLAIPQNVQELLAFHEIAFVECGPIRAVPEPYNNQWIRRQDMVIRFRRKVTRIYAVRNIVAADIHLFDDTHVDELIRVPPPAP